jgi:uncharacterized protein (DUF697 family)/GTP-binding protein EngB required for normal cell division
MFELSDRDFSFDELLKELSNTYRQAEAKIGRCNILVIGKTGVGKSTLINSVFREPLAKTGKGNPVTTGIRQYTKQDFPVTVYDTPGLELSGTQIKELISDVSDLIDEKRFLEPKEHIHVVWYCLNHGGDRLESIEKKWLHDLNIKDVPVVLVVTKTLTRKRSDFVAALEGENLPVHQIIPVLAESMEIDEDYTAKTHGLDSLMKVTFELLPEVAKKAFTNASKNIDLKGTESLKYVSRYVTGALAVGAAPIPFSDAPLLATIQTSMLVDINLIFGLPYEKAFISTVLAAIVGTGGVSLVGRSIVANLLKMMPGAGTAVGAAISASTAAALTWALGLAYIESLKTYMKAKINGKEMPLEELANLIVKNYKNYAKSGQKTLRELPSSM